MNLFEHFGEVISRRRLHKNTTNNVVVSELWKRCEELAPEYQETFRNFVVAASGVAEMFFFDDGHPKEIKAKRYSIVQFRLFYDVVLCTFVHFYGIANPRLATQLTTFLRVVSADFSRIEKLITRFRKHSTIDTSAVGEAYAHLIEEAGIGSASFEPFTAFTSGCLIAYNSALANHE